MKPRRSAQGLRDATSILAALAIVAGLVAWLPAPALALNPQPEPPAPMVYLDTGPLSFDVQPANVNGRLLVPMRVIFETLGAVIDRWDGATQTVYARKGGISIVLQVGNATAFVNGRPFPLDAPPANLRGRILVPLRFVSEALGAAVAWDGTNRRVLIDSPPIVDRSAEVPPLLGDVFKLPGTPPGEWLLGENPDEPPTGLPGLYDAFVMAAAGKKAGLPKTVIPNVSASPPPTYLDYWKYVTLIGDQDGWGGQIQRAATHAVSILREMEHRYAPDSSYWWLQYASGYARDQYAAANPSEPWTSWPDFTEQVLEGTSPSGFAGICAEASLLSDFDPLTLVPVKDQYGEFVEDEHGSIVWKYVFDKMPKPDAADKAEAGLYTMTEWSDPITVASEGVDGLKWYLRRFGPLTALGPLSWVNGNWQNVDHCVTIVGYDDKGATTRTVAGQTTTYTGYFRCLDSRGDTFNGSGFFNIPYDVAETQFTSFRYFLTKPLDTSGTPYAYTARIRAYCSVGRNCLKIRLGVEGATAGSGGHVAQVIWDTPNQDPRNCPDSGRQVVIDVPLPSYAAEHWPPSASNRWFIEVLAVVNTETTTDVKAEIRGFEVARLKRNAACQSVNKYESQVFAADSAFLPKSVKQSWGTSYPAFCYIKTPEQGPPGLILPPAERELSLNDPGDGPFTPGQALTLQGGIGNWVSSGGVVGAPIMEWQGLSDAEIRLYEADLGACVNLPAEWTLLESVISGRAGGFTFNPKPSAGWHCYAAAYVRNGKVEASTQPVLVYVGTPPGPGLFSQVPTLPVDIR
jgi:hypothetical protein